MYSDCFSEIRSPLVKREWKRKCIQSKNQRGEEALVQSTTPKCKESYWGTDGLMPKTPDTWDANPCRGKTIAYTVPNHTTCHPPLLARVYGGILEALLRSHVSLIVVTLRYSHDIASRKLHQKTNVMQYDPIAQIIRPPKAMRYATEKV